MLRDALHALVENTAGQLDHLIGYFLHAPLWNPVYGLETGKKVATRSPMNKTLQ
jgi:hypothetical protein